MGGLSEGGDFRFLPAVGMTVGAVGMVGARSIFIAMTGG